MAVICSSVVAQILNAHLTFWRVIKNHNNNQLCLVKCYDSLSLSVLMAIFQGLMVFIEAKDDGGGGDNWTTGAISRAKLQSNHHHQQTNIQFLLH